MKRLKVVSIELATKEKSFVFPIHNLQQSPRLLKQGDVDIV